MLKVLLQSQTEELPPFADERLTAHIRYGQVNKFECFDGFDLMAFRWYDVHQISDRPVPVTIFFSREDLIFLCGGEECRERVKAMADGANSDSVRALYAFFSALIRDDIDRLEELEERITDAEDELITAPRREYAGEIVAFRRELLRFKRYYEQLNQIFEGLTQNENGLIPPADLRFFRVLDSRVDRLYAHVLNLRDYVTQVREAYQAQIDIEQNMLMKVFTVVTAIFLPLTLLVGWYGMNLRMPEYNWDYGYPVVIAVSVAVAVFCIWLFKRKKWL